MQKVQFPRAGTLRAPDRAEPDALSRDCSCDSPPLGYGRGVVSIGALERLQNVGDGDGIIFVLERLINRSANAPEAK